MYRESVRNASRTSGERVAKCVGDGTAFAEKLITIYRKRLRKRTRKWQLIPTVRVVPFRETSQSSQKSENHITSALHILQNVRRFHSTQEAIIAVTAGLPQPGWRVPLSSDYEHPTLKSQRAGSLWLLWSGSRIANFVLAFRSTRL